MTNRSVQNAREAPSPADVKQASSCSSCSSSAAAAAANRLTHNNVIEGFVGDANRLAIEVHPNAHP